MSAQKKPIVLVPNSIGNKLPENLSDEAKKGFEGFEVIFFNPDTNEVAPDVLEKYPDVFKRAKIGSSFTVGDVSEFVGKTPNVDVYISLMAGLNNYKKLAPFRPGVKVANGDDLHNAAVVDLAETMIKSHILRVVDTQFEYREGKWITRRYGERRNDPKQTWRGKHMLVYGKGIGGDLVERLLTSKFGKIELVTTKRGVFYTEEDEYVKRVPIKIHASSELISDNSADNPLRQADIHVFILPGDGTENMINAEFIAKLKPGSIIANFGRGNLVDEAAVKAALLSGHLGGFITDVASVEPPPPNWVFYDPAVHGVVSSTPHMAGGFADIEGFEHIGRNLLRYKQGLPLKGEHDLRTWKKLEVSHYDA